MCPFMNDFQNFGAEFISTKIKRINNPFLKDVFSSYKVFLDSLKPRTWDQFLTHPIWFNSNLRSEELVCFIGTGMNVEFVL